MLISTEGSKADYAAGKSLALHFMRATLVIGILIGPLPLLSSQLRSLDTFFLLARSSSIFHVNPIPLTTNPHHLDITINKSIRDLPRPTHYSPALYHPMPYGTSLPPLTHSHSNGNVWPPPPTQRHRQPPNEYHPLTLLTSASDERTSSPFKPLPYDEGDEAFR